MVALKAEQDAAKADRQTSQTAGAISEFKYDQANRDESIDTGVDDESDKSSDSVAEERKAALLSYKRECRERNVRVTDEMIAKAASPSWNDRTQVTWWKRNDPNSKPIADQLIRSVFKKKPHLQ